MDEQLRIEDHPSRDELQAGLDHIRRSPSDQGGLEAIVIRPRVNHRRLLETGALSPERGLEGDCWATGSGMKAADGGLFPDTQITLMNARCIALLARTRDRWALAGDQLYVDLDLSVTNLPPGTRLEAGSALLEITAEPHKGCKKFAERYGVEATRFVNSRDGLALRLRGVYAKVLDPGTLTVGDAITRLG